MNWKKNKTAYIIMIVGIFPIPILYFITINYSDCESYYSKFNPDQYLKDHEVTLAHDKRMCNEAKYAVPFLGAIPTMLLIMGGWSLTWSKPNDTPSKPFTEDKE